MHHTQSAIPYAPSELGVLEPLEGQTLTLLAGSVNWHQKIYSVEALTVLVPAEPDRSLSIQVWLCYRPDMDRVAYEVFVCGLGRDPYEEPNLALCLCRIASLYLPPGGSLADAAQHPNSQIITVLPIIQTMPVPQRDTLGQIVTKEIQETAPDGTITIRREPMMIQKEIIVTQ